MKINKDYMKVMRTGTSIYRREIHRKQIESAVIVAWCMILAALIITGGLLCAMIK